MNTPRLASPVHDETPPIECSHRLPLRNCGRCSAQPNVLIGRELYSTSTFERIATISAGDESGALDLINRADRAQARRHYTEAARLNARAEAIATISWAIDEPLQEEPR